MKAANPIDGLQLYCLDHLTSSMSGMYLGTPGPLCHSSVFQNSDGSVTYGPGQTRTT
ncbi:hypothetical protein HDU98_000335, partial [Podochytrium sp. JEL0797]